MSPQQRVLYLFGRSVRLGPALAKTSLPTASALSTRSDANTLALFEMDSGRARAHGQLQLRYFHFRSDTVRSEFPTT